jgi:hypothetical protein
MKSRSTLFAILLLFTVSLSHVGFAQDDGDLKPLFKSVTIENQTAAPLYVAVQQFTNFESQPSQTSLIVNQYAEALLPVKHQECIAYADYGSCSSAAVMNKNINPKKLFAFRSTIYHSYGGMPL